MLDRASHQVGEERQRLGRWARTHQVGERDLRGNDRALEMLEARVLGREARPRSLIGAAVRVEVRVTGDTRRSGGAAEATRDDGRIETAGESVQQARMTARQRLRA